MGKGTYRRDMKGLVSRSLSFALKVLRLIPFAEHSSHTKTQACLNLIPPIQHGPEAALLDADPLLSDREAHDAARAKIKSTGRCRGDRKLSRTAESLY